MFLPLKDINPTHRTPFVTIGLIAANVMVFVYQLSLGPRMNAFVASFGAIPFEITRMTDLVGYAGGSFVQAPGPTPIFLTLFTSMFMHGSIVHLGGNMLYLWIFGNNVEDILGPAKFLLFYFATGLAAHALHIAFDPSSTVPTIGASGAVSGILGAYLVAFPGAQVLTLMFLFFFIRLIFVPAFVIIIFWFVLQLVEGIYSLQGVKAGGIAYFAHIGGFVAGFFLIRVMAGSVIRWLRGGGWDDYDDDG